MFGANVIKESSRGYDAIPLRDEFLTRRKIFLSRRVDSETMDDLFQKLYFLDYETPGEEIQLFINSLGGEVRSGLAVFDLIRGMKSPVTTVCNGTAASMGAMIFLAGEKRIMLPHTKLMIHDPSYEKLDIGHKKPDEIDKFVKDLKKARDLLVELIVSRTGKPEDEIRMVTKEDSFFDAKEALEFGLATEIQDKITTI